MSQYPRLRAIKARSMCDGGRWNRGFGFGFTDCDLKNSVDIDCESETCQTLIELKFRLANVAAAPTDEPFSAGGNVELAPLVGLSHADFRASLGEPRECEGRTYMEHSRKEERRVAPCRNDNNWFYSFYYLPDGWVGGGPELLLYFDDEGICTDAMWRFTQ